MKTISGYPFPETAEEVETWEPFVCYHALHRQVLCVARTRAEGKWAAYCGPVPGQNHDLETGPILREGNKLREREARPMFPRFDEIPYAR